ncbi:MAG: hypothetical protein Q7V40_00260 [Pseudolabrys sp.]|nr:hypothetical protein [Pseudolabrys sp.]
MIRSIETRLRKLEATRRAADNMLLLWVKPDGNIDDVVSAAKSDGLFVPGDHVICVDWLGDDEPPAPKWSQNLRKELSKIEYGYCIETLERRFPASIRAKHRYPAGIQYVLTGMSDDRLFHLALGVQTRPISASQEQRDAAVATFMRADT